MNDFTHTISPGPGLGKDPLNLFPVSKLNLTPRRIDNKLRDEVAGHLLLLLKEQVPKFADPGKLLPIGRNAPGINMTSPAVLVNAVAMNTIRCPVSLAGGAVAAAMAANRVKTL